MGISARTSDLTGARLPEGYIKLVTSAGNAVYVADPAEANLYHAQNRAQLGADAGRSYNDEISYS